MYFRSRPPLAVHDATRGRCSTASCGCCGQDRRGATFPRNSAPGKPAGGCSTNGTPTGRWSTYSSACKQRLSRRVPSTNSYGASMARPCEQRGAQQEVEKKRSQGAWRPRIRPLAWGFFDENPHSLRRAWTAARIPLDRWPNA